MAASVPKSIKALLQETIDLVEQVVTDTFGGFSGGGMGDAADAADDGGEGDIKKNNDDGDLNGDGNVFATMEVEVNEYDYDNGHG